MAERRESSAETESEVGLIRGATDKMAEDEVTGSIEAKVEAMGVKGPMREATQTTTGDFLAYGFKALCAPRLRLAGARY